MPWTDLDRLRCRQDDGQNSLKLKTLVDLSRINDEKADEAKIATNSKAYFLKDIFVSLDAYTKYLCFSSSF